jgi:UDP:flavonoid glycosyltransferase YjiC (YdhE family)
MNSGHGSVASALLAGRPSLQLPLYQEQGFNARAVRRLGAGVDAPVDDGEAIVAALGRVLDDADEYARGAGRFAARHGWFDARRQRERMLGETLALLE